MASKGAPVWLVVVLVLGAYALGRGAGSNVAVSEPTVAAATNAPTITPPPLPRALPAPRPQASVANTPSAPASLPPPDQVQSGGAAPSVSGAEATPPSAGEATIDTSTADVRFVGNAPLHVLDAPIAGAAVLKTISPDQAVLVMADANGWSLISLGQDKFGWAQTTNLRDALRASTTVLATAEPPPATSSSSYQDPMPAPPVIGTPACSESGSCYGDISSITGLPKTTYVSGYYRKNGTYVRSYYRSHR